MNLRFVAAVGDELGSLPGAVLGVGPVVAAPQAVSAASMVSATSVPSGNSAALKLATSS